VYRRRLLHTLSVGGFALGSGCLDTLSDRSRYLEGLYVRNDADSRHEFSLAIERSGETVQETTVEVNQSEGPVRVDCERAGRGPFAVRCTLSGDQTKTVHVADLEAGSGGYADITFIATSSGELSWSGVLDDGGVRRCSGSPTK